MEEAREVVARFERAQAAGVGSLALEGGQFVDRAVVERARAVLALAARLPGADVEGSAH
jgi:citrate lyase subunit beta/citryl-CoA lyase